MRVAPEHQRRRASRHPGPPRFRRQMLAAAAAALAGGNQPNEIASNLKGVTPVSPTLSITPENWYFVK
jgi:hypothetical protein